MKADNTHACALELKGKSVIVTGAAMGIGKAIAASFAEKGACVAVADVDIEAANQSAKALKKKYGVPVISSKCDVSKGIQIQESVNQVIKTFGKVDVLVNNAGIGSVCHAENCSEEEWDRVLNVNLKGVFLCSQVCAKFMIKQREGSIINISSIQSEAPFPSRVAYNVSKAGVNMITKTMAIEWAKYGIRVNAVAPGYTRTEMLNNLIRQGVISKGEVLRRIPMGRMAAPQEIANACTFLASESASYITGVVLFVDGGWTSYGYGVDIEKEK